MSTLPSFRQLRYLVALSERLNFTQAASECFVTQSTLSAGLKELEDILGAKLVERDRQRVLMTALGTSVAERARAVIAGAMDIMSLAASEAEPLAGLLRLGVIPTIAPFVLPEVLPMLRDHAPKLKLALREDLTANLLERLHDGRLDMALLALPYETEELLVRPLCSEGMWLVTRDDDSAFSRKKTLSLEHIDTERLLLLEEGHCLRGHTLSSCGLNEPSTGGSFEATSLFTLVQMVSAGTGIALIPEMAVASGFLTGAHLSAKRIAGTEPARTIALVTRSTYGKVQDFELLAKLIGKCKPPKPR